MTKSELITAMDAHDAEGARLEKAMADLGLDVKALKAIRKAEKAAEKARATLAELMGEPTVVATNEIVIQDQTPETPPPETTTDETETPADGVKLKGGK